MSKSHQSLADGDWEQAPWPEYIEEEIERVDRMLGEGKCPGCGQDPEGCPRELEAAIEGRLGAMAWQRWVMQLSPERAFELLGWCAEHEVHADEHPHGGYRCPECEAESIEASKRFMAQLREEHEDE